MLVGGCWWGAGVRVGGHESMGVYEGLSISTFRNVVMLPLNLNGIMAIFWKAEVDSPAYVCQLVCMISSIQVRVGSWVVSTYMCVCMYVCVCVCV